MMSLFLEVGNELLSADPDIKAEYDRLVETATAAR
jgi:hypothetical protein